MIERLPAELADRLRLDASCLPVRSGSVGTLVCMNMFLFAGEARRVLRPGGALVWVNSMGSRTPIHLSAERVGRRARAGRRGGRVRGRVGHVGGGTTSQLTRRAAAPAAQMICSASAGDPDGRDGVDRERRDPAPGRRSERHDRQHDGEVAELAEVGRIGDHEVVEDQDEARWWRRRRGAPRAANRRRSGRRSASHTRATAAASQRTSVCSQSDAVAPVGGQPVDRWRGAGRSPATRRGSRPTQRPGAVPGRYEHHGLPGDEQPRPERATPSPRRRVAAVAG